jgi:hypothetical protein
MKHGVCDVPLWAGETKFVKPTAETTISLSQIEVKSTGKEGYLIFKTEDNVPVGRI